MDLAKDATTWITKIQNKASKLMAPIEDSSKKRISGGLPGSSSPSWRLTRTSGIRRLSRQSSGEPATPGPKQILQYKFPKRGKMKKEAVDLLLTANLKREGFIKM